MNPAFQIQGLIGMAGIQGLALIRFLSIAFGALALSACLAPSHSRTESQAPTVESTLRPIAQLNDDGYFGGLSDSDVELGQQLVRAAGFPPSDVCPPPDPLQGTLIGNVGSHEQNTAELPFSLRTMLEFIAGNSSRHARDVVAFAIGRIGPALQGHAHAIDDLWPRTPWLRESSARVLCEQVAAARADAVLPNGHEMSRCAATREIVLQMATKVLRWPREILAPSNEPSCGFDQDESSALLRVIENENQLVDTRIDALALVHGRADQQRRNAAALEALRAQFEDTAFEISQTSTGKIQYLAEELLIDLHSAAGAQILVRRLDQHESDLFWGGEVCRFRERGDILVPALARELSDSVWATRVSAARELACFADTRSVPALNAALDAPDYALQEEALVTLSHIRPWHRATTSTVVKLAKNHWSARLRRLAKTALSGAVLPTTAGPRFPGEKGQSLDSICIGICAKDQGQQRCKSGKIEDGKYRINGEGIVSVEWREAGKQPVDAARLGDLAKRTEHCSTTMKEVGSVTFVGLSCFEWTGGAYVLEQGKEPRQIYDQGIEGIYKVGNRTFVVAAAFLFVEESGLIGELVDDGSNVWQIEPVVSWPGIPGYFAFSPAGRLLLSDGDNALSLDANGRLAAMECKQ
jgi:hypothetical protein